MKYLEAYYTAVRIVSTQGVKGVTEDGEDVLTLDTPLTLCIDSPTQRTVFPYGMGESSAAVYAYQMLNPVRDNNPLVKFSYTYGGRLREFVGVDQLQAIVDRLTASKSSRRAVVSFYNPVTDHDTDEVPCMNHLQMRLVNRGGFDYLDCYVVFRSHDILSAWFFNVYGIIAIMEKVRSKLPSAPGMGKLYVTPNIPHIYYTRDADVLDRVTKEMKVSGYYNE